MSKSMKYFPGSKELKSIRPEVFVDMHFLKISILNHSMQLVSIFCGCGFIISERVEYVTYLYIVGSEPAYILG